MDLSVAKPPSIFDRNYSEGAVFKPVQAGSQKDITASHTLSFGIQCILAIQFFGQASRDSMQQSQGTVNSNFQCLSHTGTKSFIPFFPQVWSDERAVRQKQWAGADFLAMSCIDLDFQKPCIGTPIKPLQCCRSTWQDDWAWATEFGNTIQVVTNGGELRDACVWYLVQTQPSLLHTSFAASVKTFWKSPALGRHLWCWLRSCTHFAVLLSLTVSFLRFGWVRGQGWLGFHRFGTMSVTREWLTIKSELD